MLVSFSVANFKSIKEKQTISMVAYDEIKQDEEHIIKTPDNQPDLLTSVGIYGANASGKSNLLEAMEFMKDFIGMSFNRAPLSPIETVPFKLAGLLNFALPSEFEIEFISDNIQYRYGFAVDSKRVTKEYLYGLSLEKELFGRGEELFFKREYVEYNEGEYIWEGEYREEKYTKQLADDSPRTRDNGLYLSFSLLLGIKKFKPVFNWFGGFFAIDRNIRLDYPSHHFISNDETEMMEIDKLTVKILQCADINIEKILVKKENFDDDSFTLKYKFIHKDEEGENITFDLEEESEGTRTLLKFAKSIIRTIQNGGLLVIDEIESSLHPEIVKEIIFLFNDPEKNPKNAQLIFTTHNTHFLQFFRRDQIWFTEKNKEQATELYSLADFKEESDETQEMLERLYLSGAYGGIPNIIEWEINDEE